MIRDIGTFLANSPNVYLFIAVLGTAIFAIQFIMSMAGLHSDADLADFDTAVDSHDIGDITGLNFFTIKSIVAFVAFFGWGGYFWGYLGWGGLAIAFVCGLIMMFLTALVVWLLLKMQQDGNIQSADLVGKYGKVYLSIPAGRQPGGKVTVTLPGCTRQISACSDNAIPTGSEVLIAEDLGGGYFLVRTGSRNN